MFTYEFINNHRSVTTDDLRSINLLLSQLANRAPTVDLPHLAMVIQNSRLLVARDPLEFWGNRAGLIVGMATLVPVMIPVGRCANIHDVVTDESYRGRGIARELMERLITEARRMNIERIYLTSQAERLAANHLYQKLGFELVTTNPYRLVLVR